MLYLIIFLAFSSLAPMVIHFWGAGINHDLLILISALTAVISFHILNFGQNKKTYRMLQGNHRLQKNVLYIILTTALMWVGGFILPLKYTPFVYVFTYLGWPSLCGALVMALSSRRISYLTQTILISLIFIAFYWRLFIDYPRLKAIIGLAATFMTGFSLYLYLRFSKQLNQQGMDSRQVLALRYWLLLIVPVVLVISRHEYNLLNSLILFKGVIIGLITLVLPLYCGQICVEKFGSENFSLFMGFTPILTFLLQFFLIQTEVSQILLALLLALAIALPFLSGLVFKKLTLKLCS